MASNGRREQARSEARAQMDSWIGIVETATDVVTARSAQGLHDLLERAGEPPRDGDPIPLLWHWLAFLPRARQSELAADGHPRTGGFLPPMGGKRRMYAGGRVRSAGGELRVGEVLQQTSRVADVRERHGASGPLTVVEIDRKIEGVEGQVQERVDLIYTDAAPSGRRAQPAQPAPVNRARTVPIDPTLLFRFSALTYNAHRIHYDRDYATGVEGYPGLVVQGPLQAILLAGAAERSRPGRAVVEFGFRAVAPAFDDAPLELAEVAGADAGDSTTLDLVATSGGRTTMTARAVLDARSR